MTVNAQYPPAPFATVTFPAEYVTVNADVFPAISARFADWSIIYKQL